MKQRLLATVFLVIAPMLFSGCGLTDKASQKANEKMAEKYLEKSIEAQSGGKADVDLSGDEASVTTDQGTTAVSQTGQAKLPDDFPADVFVYDDAAIAYSSSYVGPPKIIAVNYYTADAPDQVFDKYKIEMEKSGWTKNNEVDMGAQNTMMLDYKKENKSIMISITVEANVPNAGKTIVGINETSK